MELIKLLLVAAFSIGGLVGWVIILIDAFQDSIWKGLGSILCGLYGLYYAFAEFEHDNKWLIVLLAIGGSGIAAGISRL